MAALIEPVAAALVRGQVSQVKNEGFASSREIRVVHR